MVEQEKTSQLPEIKLLEAALARSLERQQSTFKPSDVKVPEATKLAENLSTIAEHSQKLVQEFISKQAQGEIVPFTIPDPGIVGNAFFEMTQKLLANPEKLMQAQATFWHDYFNMWQVASRRALGEDVEPAIAPDPGDKRFKEPEWADNAIFDFIKQSYLLTSRSLYHLFTNVDGLDKKTAEKVDFYTRRITDAMSPTNFALTNPQVIRATFESGGENLINGLSNLLEDLNRGKGRLHIKMTDMDAFKLGKNIATTPGKVIYQTELMQLIQYTPSTEQVFERPLLLVPPWINKFYILDLQPKNSFVKWAVEQGFTVFVISWVNPDEELAETGFENYLSQGTLAALDAIEKATGVANVNCIGYCIGGTLLFSTAAYLAAKQDDRIASVTGFTTMLDYEKVGELSVFIDDEQFAHVDKGMEEKGYLEGFHMAGVFSLMRANDLIWAFVVRNYLLGQAPFPFDLLYWNADSTRMPKAMHSFYLRNMYLHNKLKDPGSLNFLGQPIDLGKIKTPVYFLSAKEDHIAPWSSTYAGTQLVGGPVTFVLGESGHIAGIINPPQAGKYSYWTNEKLPKSPDKWAKDASQHEGSWWLHWLEWVKQHSGPQVPARIPGDGALAPLEDAPGSYVRVRDVEPA
jgi:polyhydroxyalkanoate synthase